MRDLAVPAWMKWPMLCLGAPPVLLYPCHCQWLPAAGAVFVAGIMGGFVAHRQGSLWGTGIGLCSAVLATAHLIRIGAGVDLSVNAMLLLLAVALPKLGALVLAGTVGGFCGGGLSIVTTAENQRHSDRDALIGDKDSSALIASSHHK